MSSGCVRFNSSKHCSYGMPRVYNNVPIAPSHSNGCCCICSSKAINILPTALSNKVRRLYCSVFSGKVKTLERYSSGMCGGTKQLSAILRIVSLLRGERKLPLPAKANARSRKVACMQRDTGTHGDALRALSERTRREYPAAEPCKS